MPEVMTMEWTQGKIPYSLDVELEPKTTQKFGKYFAEYSVRRADTKQVIGNIHRVSVGKPFVAKVVPDGHEYIERSFRLVVFMCAVSTLNPD